MSNRAFLLFTTEDLGPGFDEDSFTNLVAQLVAQGQLSASADNPPYQLVAFGLPPSQYTNHAGNLKQVFNRFAFVYPLTQRQHQTLTDLLYVLDQAAHGSVAATLPPTPEAVPLPTPTPAPELALAPVETAFLDGMGPTRELWMRADLLRYRLKSPGLSQEQQSTILARLEPKRAEGNLTWFTTALTNLNQLEMRTTAPVRGELMKYLAATCTLLLSHAQGVPDSWSTTMVPRIEGARQRSDDEALAWLQGVSEQILTFHFNRLEAKSVSLYEQKFGLGNE